MINYAEIIDGVVANIIVSTEASISTLPGQFVKINDALNGASCTTGSTYNEEKNAFARQKPYGSWTLNEDTFAWEPPVAKPTESISIWDEESLVWVDVTPVEIELNIP